MICSCGCCRLRPLPHPPDQLPSWLRCPECSRWVTAAGVELHPTPIAPTAGPADTAPLCPDRHEEP